MEKKEEEMPKRISAVELVSKKPEGRYVLDEEAYIGMIDEYNMHREYILNRLSDVGKLEREMDSIFKPPGSHCGEVMWEIINSIERHRRVEKEVSWELYKIRNILEKMKNDRKGMELGKYTIIEPWEKSPLKGIVKFKQKMTGNKMDTFSYCGKEPWVLDWKTYETVLVQFLQYRKRVMESLEMIINLDGMDGDPEDMVWGLIESEREMYKSNGDAVRKLEEIIYYIDEYGGLLRYKKKPNNLVKLVPFSLYAYDNPRWYKIKKTM